MSPIKPASPLKPVIPIGDTGAALLSDCKKYTNAAIKIGISPHYNGNRRQDSDQVIGLVPLQEHDFSRPAKVPEKTTWLGATGPDSWTRNNTNPNIQELIFNRARLLSRRLKVTGFI
jgi:hypothetical protein